MIKEVEIWNSKKKIFEELTSGDVYYVCDNCMEHNEEGGHIDTEGDY